MSRREEQGCVRACVHACMHARAVRATPDDIGLNYLIEDRIVR
jgi:hypothetical protein